MLFTSKSASQKRAEFRAALRSGKLLRFPGAFSPLVSLLIERHGFEGVYISGAVLSADLALPDVGLTTLTEVAQRGRAIARVTSLPAIIDADTGFGEPMNAARTRPGIRGAGPVRLPLRRPAQPEALRPSRPQIARPRRRHGEEDPRRHQPRDAMPTSSSSPAPTPANPKDWPARSSGPRLMWMPAPT